MIIHVVGNRPQFIKLAPLYHELKQEKYEQLIIHSGQHYDENMSDVFFRELDIPNPYVNLMIGSGTHAEITAKTMVGLERELSCLAPQLIILYGDTDTTVAGALVASKLNIPIAHVEGGVRTFNKSNPEECNRIVTDHLASIIFCPDKVSLSYACSEGLEKISNFTGDIMYDTYLSVADDQNMINADEIILLTWHRQENTSDVHRMKSIIKFIKRLKGNIVCPLHPRTLKCLEKYSLMDEFLSIKNLKITEPVGYREMISLMMKAKLIVTDSGGVSKESSFAGAKCLFMLDLNVWTDLIKAGWIQKINPEDETSIKEALLFAENAKKIEKNKRPQYYGDGHAARAMVNLLQEKKMIDN